MLKLVVGRLRDRSSNVRKQAVQLLTILLQCNPYNSSLPVEDIKEQVKIEEKSVMVFCYQNCFGDREKLLKFEAEGREFEIFLRSLEQFIQTVKDQNNF